MTAMDGMRDEDTVTLSVDDYQRLLAIADAALRAGVLSREDEAWMLEGEQ